jgi:hypothetical protein
VTTTSAAVFMTRQIGLGTTTSVTIGNYTDAGVAGPWAAKDRLIVSCLSY